MSKGGMKKTKKRTKKINFDVYNAKDEEIIAEKLLKRRGGGGSLRNYDEFIEEKTNYQTENIDEESSAHGKYELSPTQKRAFFEV